LERKLAEIGIATIEDLATTYPRDYKDWRKPTPIAEIVRRALERAVGSQTGESFEEIAVAEVTSLREIRARVSLVSAELSDASGKITATWFGRCGLTRSLSVGDRVFVHGRVSLKRMRGALGVELNVLNHRRMKDGEDYVGAVVPVYPATKDVGSRTIAKVIAANFDVLAESVADEIPEAILRARGFPPLRDAWCDMHRPRTPEAALAAREVLIFAEFFDLALGAALRRVEREQERNAPEIMVAETTLAEFAATLPFSLTGGQRRAIAQIYADLRRPVPMNRLLQGDVGSGKTSVAAAAIVGAYRGGVQSALMAPTEILAAQHAAKLVPLLLPLGIRTEALFGSMGDAARERVRARIASGECELVVGTHALLTDGVSFNNLGLVVIDEQHRFGVHQRAKLRAKGCAPHTLAMTATPIPRTLAQTRFADLDFTLIDELPPGRTPVETYVLRESRKLRAYELIRKNIAKGRQAYVIAPAIDDRSSKSERDSGLTQAIEEYDYVRTEVFPDLRVGLVHGRLPSREKEDVMSSFVRGEIDVLLATTVVEVGVDVPNAVVMVILDAHRYGLAQLHQLRGRVGRGSARSYCVLVSPDERGAGERLDILARTNDGFAIAEHDLRLRHEGELAGTEQSGRSQMLGSLIDDFALYMKAKADADALAASDPNLSRPEHQALRKRIERVEGEREIRVSS
jgi:ATP-dependent DNA helicase RecG